MTLILFIHQDASKKGSVLKDVIDQNFYETKRETLHTYTAVKERFKNTPAFLNQEIVILMSESRDRLYQLMPLIDFLENRRTILILPDESKETLSLASQFSPRFFTVVSDTYSDLCDVLNRMINPVKE